MQSLKFNPTYRYHILVALFISTWLSSFLILIAPFDIAELPFSIRLRILPLYGLISFSAYVLLIPLQNWLYKSYGKWTIFMEVIFIVLFNIINYIGCFIYYQSDIINGTYSFLEFTFEIFLPILFILLPILILSRWFIGKKSPNFDSEVLVLTGENKRDIIKTTHSDLICISSADNYVEVNYLINKRLNKKLLRTTLKDLHSKLPSLVKVHRSYIINPSHFKAWKNANTLILTHMEVPISKNYKQAIIDLKYSSQKPHSSSQNQ